VRRTRLTVPQTQAIGPTRPVSLSPCLLVSLSFIFLARCDFPGQPSPADRPVPANQVLDFGALYTERCAGCHGADGKLGPAPPLNDPIFLTIVPDAELLRVISEGRTVSLRQKSLMPAFAHDNGGPLTSAQVKVLAEGIKKHWHPSASPSGSLPAYLGRSTNSKSVAERTDLKSVVATADSKSVLRSEGDKDECARVFARACAGCHGSHGRGDKDGRPLPGGAINNQAFLALISDQALRRIIITGRPDLGMPAYDGKTGRSPDFRALTSGEIDDLVGLLRHWRRMPND
jgi:cytochrome c oxidase cbb3-type subunit III